MQSFKDTEGRSWVVAVNALLLKRVRALTGVNLVALIDDSMKPLSALLADPITLVDVLFVLCADEAQRRNVTDEQFGAALGGDSLGQAAQAFVEALVDFFPDPKRRERIRRVIEAGKEIAQEIGAKADEELARMDPREVARDYLQSASGNSSGSLAELPESTPGR